MKTLRSLVAAAICTLTAPAFAATITIDFETDGAGNALAAGTVIDDEYAALGITIEAISNGSFDLAMIFDSSNPTGGDTDLGTPNEVFGGPGQGTGGTGTNSVAQGNILIISEDGDSSDPDDEARGGTIRVFFDGAVTMESIGILDIDADEGEAVKLFDSSGNLLASPFTFQKVGNNGFQEIALLNVSGVSRMEVVFTGSGAITDFQYTTQVPEPTTGAILGLGLAAIGLRRRKTR